MYGAIDENVNAMYKDRKIERSKDRRAGSGSEKRLVPDDLAAETARHEDGVSR